VTQKRSSSPTSSHTPDPAPSGEDIRITAELAEAGRLLDIELLDHLVIGHGRWASLRALGAVGQPATTR
jgi:DNA repair protein RadC